MLATVVSSVSGHVSREDKLVHRYLRQSLARQRHPDIRTDHGINAHLHGEGLLSIWEAPHQPHCVLNDVSEAEERKKCGPPGGPRGTFWETLY